MKGGQGERGKGGGEGEREKGREGQGEGLLLNVEWKVYEQVLCCFSIAILAYNTALS